MMKKNILLVALACAALSFVGCDDDLDFGNTQAVEKFFDQEVNFGGSASYNLADKQNAATRTIYGGYQQDALAEPVYWLSTDQVRLFCNESSIKSADYKVTVAEDETKVTKTGLDKIADAGLRWGNPESQHTFYGVYPIPTDNSLKESTVLAGTIPAVQDYEKYTTSGGSYVFAPNMDYAYMVAKTVVENPNEIGENVFLKFTPIATAVEIELKNNANESGTTYNFREIHLSSAKHYLSGSFTANLDKMTIGDGTNVKYATGCPTGITYGDDVSKQAAVKLYVDGGAVALAPQKTLKFTIFMLPSTSGADDTDAIDDLEITLVTSEGNKTGTLTGISIKKSKKSYMHAMPIGADMTYNQSEWLKYVDDDKKLNELSIPGAGGASSGNIFGRTTDNVDNYLEQSLSIEELWNVGIRCFEFTVDYADSYDTNGNPVTDGSLNNNVVYCNAQPTGLTLDDCVTEVKRLLGEHPEEFAMVIITYQQQSGWNVRNDDGTVNQTRDPKVFMNQFNDYWDNLQMVENTDTRKALYDSDLTVETARGSLFCIARPTSQGEDNHAEVSTTPKYKQEWSWEDFSYVDTDVVDYYTLNSTKYSALAWDAETDVAKNVLVIHGWGALKDKWYVRGYTDCVYFRMGGNGHFDHVTNAENSTGLSLENQVLFLGYRNDRATKPGRPFDVSSQGDASGSLNDEYEGVSKTTDLGLTPNFTYSTITNEDNKVLSTTRFAWVQEWARVSNSSANYSTSSGNDVAYWVSSIDEKKAHISDCLIRSISKDETDKTIYINSLCGYFIIDGTTDVAHNSASPNSLTECNFAYSVTIGGYSGEKKFNPLTGAGHLSGMCGNIEGFATAINTYFLGELNSKLTSAGRLAGSTGIVLMDRVSNDANDDGAKIPSIIIANNFAPDQNATGASYSIRTSNLEDGDAVLSNGYRGVVWGEWEK